MFRALSRLLLADCAFTSSAIERLYVPVCLYLLTIEELETLNVNNQVIHLSLSNKVMTQTLGEYMLYGYRP